MSIKVCSPSRASSFSRWSRTSAARRLLRAAGLKVSARSAAVMLPDLCPDLADFRPQRREGLHPTISSRKTRSASSTVSIGARDVRGRGMSGVSFGGHLRRRSVLGPSPVDLFGGGADALAVSLRRRPEDLATLQRDRGTRGRHPARTHGGDHRLCPPPDRSGVPRSRPDGGGGSFSRCDWIARRGSVGVRRGAGAARRPRHRGGPDPRRASGHLRDRRRLGRRDRLGHHPRRAALGRRPSPAGRRRARRGAPRFPPRPSATPPRRGPSP